MGEMADGWAVRDEQPTHLPAHPSLHQETTGAQGVTRHAGTCVILPPGGLLSVRGYSKNTQHMGMLYTLIEHG